MAIAGTRAIGARLGATPMLAGLQNVNATRRAHEAGVDVAGNRGWAQGAYERVATTDGLDAVDSGGFTVGRGGGTDTLRYGVAISASKYQGDDSSAFDFDGHSYAASVYGAIFSPSGLYAQAAIGGGNLRMDVKRPAAYGQTAEGRADGRVFGANLQVGYTLDLGGAKVGPFGELSYADVRLDGYREHGASVSNGEIPDSKYRRTEATIGFEVAGDLNGLRPSARLGYTFVDEGGDKTVALMLADLPNSADNIRLPSDDKGFVGGELALEGDWAEFAWRTAVGVRDTSSKTSAQVSVGISRKF